MVPFVIPTQRDAIMSVEIAKAKEQDIPFLAQMILQSSRAEKKIGMFDYIFDFLDDEKIIEKLQNIIKNPLECYCYYGNFLVAKVNGKSVGTLCAYEPRKATKEHFLQALEEAGCSSGCAEKLTNLGECEFDINNRTLMFDFLEEVEGYVDVGILKALMQKALLQARLKGYRIAQSIVEIGSLETLLFYEKLSFVQKAKKESETYKEIFGRNGVVLLELEF